MQCPKCESDMEKVAFEDIEVDRCVHCHGIWCDGLEGERLKELKGSEAIDIGDPKVGKEFNKVAEAICPHCQVKMIRMVDAIQPHIWFESCGVCHGSFFDAGEFTDLKSETIVDFFRGLLSRGRE